MSNHEITIYQPWTTPGGRTVPGSVVAWAGPVTTDALIRRMTRHTRTTDKAASDSWSPVQLQPGARRSNAAVLEVSCIVLDFDDAPVWRSDIIRGLGRVRCCYHSSHSHTAEKPKGRLVVPLASPVAADLWPRVWAWVAGLIDGVDAQCKDAARVYYLPTCLEGGDPVAWEQAGPLLKLPDVLPLLPATPRWVPVEGGDNYKGSERYKGPGARANLASVNGWSVSSGTARRIPCPQCNRRSVYYVIESERKAKCGHEASCGGVFWLDQLAGV